MATNAELLARIATLEAENAAKAAELEKARAAKTNAVTIGIFSNCGVITKGKSADSKGSLCKVNPDTMKCIHGGEPKGTLGIYGLNGGKPVAMWGNQFLRGEEAYARCCALARKYPQFFQRPKAA